MANIKKIVVSGTTYDIEALHFIDGSLDTPAQWRAYIDNLAAKGTDIKVLTELPAISTVAQQKAAYAEYAGDIILIADATSVTGSYIEYVGITGKVESSTVDNAIVAWEKIGTTTTDLTQYAKVGTYTSTTPSTNATGSSGGETVDTTETDLGSATGSAKIDSHSISISAHSHAVNADTIEIGSASGWSAGTKPTSASFTYVSGVKSTGGTTTVLTGVTTSGTTAVNNDAIKDVTLSASATTTAGPVYVESVSGSAPSLGGTTTFVTGALKSASLGTTTTAADGEKVIDGISGSAPSLGGTTTFVTSALKSASLGTTTTAADGQKVIDGISGSAPSLTGTTTFVTGYPNFSGGSATGTFNTDAIKSASLDIKTSSTSGYQAFVEQVALSGGSATGTFNTDAIKSVGGTKNYGFASSIPNTADTNGFNQGVMTHPVVSSDGILS